MSASVYWFNGSRFILREPENKTGSWAQRQYKQLLKWIMKVRSQVLSAGWESVTNIVLNGRWTWHGVYFQLRNCWMSLFPQNLYKPFPGLTLKPFKTLLKEFGNEFHTWGMTVILVLRSWRPSWAISCPSIRMAPSAASTNRSNPTARLDFPAPVLPVMPICEVQWKDFGFDVDCFLTAGQTCHVVLLGLLMRDSFAWIPSLGLFMIHSQAILS